jgi:hypothetical protein
MDYFQPGKEFEREIPPAALNAARQIAATEHAASAARALNVSKRPEDMSHEERVRRLAVHDAFYGLVELQGAAPSEAAVVVELFRDNPEVVNATLARIEMNGSWEAADPFERSLAEVVWDAGYNASFQRIDRRAPEARRIFTIPAGFTEEHGYIALRRQRTLMVATHNDKEARRPHIQIDKVSTFALDIQGLAALKNIKGPDAEMRLVVASTIYKAIPWEILTHNEEVNLDDEDANLAAYILRYAGLKDVLQASPEQLRAAQEDLANLKAIMDKYGMTMQQVFERAYLVENPAVLQIPHNQQFVEALLVGRSNLVTPAATTYYVHS